jgi:NAD(P)-dependent dehydrogenase (short-subunit alcohol dehydrogenase family)
MQTKPDYGEDSCKGSGRLKDKKAVITGADSGLASDEASYMSGATIAVTGGKPIL